MLIKYKEYKNNLEKEVLNWFIKDSILIQDTKELIFDDPIFDNLAQNTHNKIKTLCKIISNKNSY